jgi:hypothetical protein
MEKHKASDWFLDWGVKFLAHWKLSDSDNIPHISSLLFQQLSDFSARVNVFSSFNTYQGFDALPQATHGDAQRIRRELLLSIWRKFLNGSATELARCALALLSITASEAAVERSFSRQGIIHSDRRNRSKDESVHHQMCVSFNCRALERAVLPPDQRLDRGITEELPDEDEDDGTALLSQPNLVAAVDEPAAPAAAEEEKDEEEAEEEEKEPIAGSEDSESAEEEKSDGSGDEAEPDRSFAMSDEQFIRWFLKRNHVTLGYRWTSVREGQLVGALMAKKMKTQARAMIDKIKAHLTVLAAVPDEQ